MIQHKHIQFSEIGRAAFQNLPDDLIWADYLPKTVGVSDLPAFYRGIYYRVSAVKDVIQHILNRKAFRRTFRQLVLAVWLGFSANDYVAYKLSDLTLSNIPNFFLGYFRRHEIRDRNNCQTCSLILRNKILLSYFLEHTGLPHNNLIAFYFKKEWHLPHNVPLASGIEMNTNKGIILRQGSYILKPAFSRWGQGVELIRVTQPGFNLQVLKPKNDVMILEIRAENEKLYFTNETSSLNTFRVMTEYDQNYGPRVFAAAVRVGISGSLVDNWSAGGVAAQIDIRNGMVGKFYKKDLQADSYPYFLSGKIVPNWQKILDVAIQAHQYFSGIKTIGWDIALTNNGIMIVEGNDDWDIVLPQRLSASDEILTSHVLPDFMINQRWP